MLAYSHCKGDNSHDCFNEGFETFLLLKVHILKTQGKKFATHNLGMFSKKSGILNFTIFNINTAYRATILSYAPARMLKMHTLQPLGVGWGKERIQERRCVCTYGAFMLMYGRNQHNIVNSVISIKK